MLDFDEVVAGLSVLCAGAGPDKARAVFDLFDYDGDGAVTEAEVARYMTAVFRVRARLCDGAPRATVTQL